MKQPRLAMPVSGSVFAASRLAISSRSLTKARRKTAVPSRNSTLSKLMSPNRLSAGASRRDDRAGQIALRSGQQNRRVQRGQDDERPAGGKPFGSGEPQGVGRRKQIKGAGRETQRVDSGPRRR